MAEIINEEREQERRDLEELIRSAGFRRLLAFAEREYSAGAQLARIDALLTHGTPDDPEQVRCAREVRVAAKAAIGILKYPEEQIKKLSVDAPDLPVVPRRAS